MISPSHSYSFDYHSSADNSKIHIYTGFLYFRSTTTAELVFSTWISKTLKIWQIQIKWILFLPKTVISSEFSVLINSTIGWLLISSNRKSRNNLKYSPSLTFLYVPYQFYHLNSVHSFPLTSISIVTALVYTTSILVWRVWAPLNDCNNLLTALLSNK